MAWTNLTKKQESSFITRHDPKDPRSLSSNYVWNLYEDHAGILWVATGFPWFNQHPEDGGLNRMEPDGTFTRFKHDPNDPHSLISNKVRAMFEDSRGVFWVGTSGDGLHTMDRKTVGLNDTPMIRRHLIS
jgi:ligand-binding sensor domain-containing protein